MKLIVPSVILGGLLAITGLALADHPKRPPHVPPKEAVDACAKKTAGDTCSFQIHDRDIAGSCDTGPDGNGPLACHPDGPPPPPPEAVEACAKSARGDTCSFTGPDGEAVSGTCDAPPDLPLACAPARAR